MSESCESPHIPPRWLGVLIFGGFLFGFICTAIVEGIRPESLPPVTVTVAGMILGAGWYIRYTTVSIFKVIKLMMVLTFIYWYNLSRTGRDQRWELPGLGTAFLMMVACLWWFGVPWLRSKAATGRSWVIRWWFQRKRNRKKDVLINMKPE